MAKGPKNHKISKPGKPLPPGFPDNGSHMYTALPLTKPKRQIQAMWHRTG